MLRQAAAIVRRSVLIGALATLALPATADTFPSRLVRFVVPQSPGGTTDVLARAVSEQLSKKWGQSVVVENRAGAAGNIGTDSVAKSPPDGYTLLVTYEGSQAINPSLYPKLPFDPIKDFQPVATIAVAPFVVITKANYPAKNLGELIALAREKPDTITYGSAGHGSVNHLVGEMLKAEAGIRIIHVPHRGIGQAITNVLGGQIDFAVASLPSVAGMLKGGDLRAIAVTSAQPTPILPGVPPVAEAGLKGFDVNPWWGILAPAGTDMAIVRKINADVTEILKEREMRDYLALQGADPFLTIPEEFRKILEANIEKWAKIVKASGARIE